MTTLEETSQAIKEDLNFFDDLNDRMQTLLEKMGETRVIEKLKVKYEKYAAQLQMIESKYQNHITNLEIELGNKQKHAQSLELQIAQLKLEKQRFSDTVSSNIEETSSLRDQLSKAKEEKFTWKRRYDECQIELEVRSKELESFKSDFTQILNQNVSDSLRAVHDQQLAKKKCKKQRAR
eukprot:TRINITY_DN4073_c0_g1_i1.p1 TRINITY_DN4073_c0_g1~~TRINITY_DN4073_c0_g1_i1.p1  ORF type:complete len:179 (+),score=40.28 TRINITY_DN4073_c0_g1_i1:89-625(+)